MAIQKLREEVLSILKELELLLLFTFQLSKDNEQRLASVRRQIDSASARVLRNWRDKFRENIARLKSTTGCRVKTKFLAELLESPEKGDHAVLYLPKWAIDRYLFSKFDFVFPGWKCHPPHALVAVHLERRDDSLYKYDVYLPEAMLYEDMCLAFNLAARSKKEYLLPKRTKIEGKTHEMFQRNAVLSAHYFVEAYLNGVAFDFWVRKNATLSNEESALLLEWDPEKKKDRWVSLRQKLLQYPKIILGLHHPPLVEANSPELAYFLKKGKDLRDAIVHQSPKMDLETLEMPKVGPLYRLGMADVREVVDVSVALVRKLNATFGKYGQDLWWLFERDESGMFPDSAFQ